MLKRIPSRNRPLFRGTSLKSDIEIQKLQNCLENKKICVLDPAFMSFSSDKNIALKFLLESPIIRTKTLIKVKNGMAPSIFSFSNYPGEKEHLYKPSTRFNVLKIKKKIHKGFDYQKIYLAEVKEGEKGYDTPEHLF